MQIEKNMKLRQGDVLLVAVDELPKGATEMPRGPRGLVLQEGTVTGHAHAISSMAAKLFVHDGVRYLRTAEPVELRHEEHKSRCSMCPEFVVSDRRLASRYDEAAYRCALHGDDNAVILGQPGSTAIPAGDYRVTIHAEYIPGELPRQVED